MKLDYWNNKFFTAELNSRYMAEANKWPLLNSILEAADKNIPMTSESRTGRSIYIGWAYIRVSGKPDMWFYHHALCSPGIEELHSRRIGFTLAKDDDSWISIASSIHGIICPVFNVGALPESLTFVKILRDHGISARIGMPALSVPELIKK